MLVHAMVLELLVRSRPSLRGLLGPGIGRGPGHPRTTNF